MTAMMASTLLRGAAPLRASSTKRASALAFSSAGPLLSFSRSRLAECALRPQGAGHQLAGTTVAAAQRVLSTRAAAGAAATEAAAEGDYVEVHYTGTLDDGEVFDTSRSRDEPLAFRIGAGKVIKGFDRAVTGLSVGQSRKQRLEPADAYGERREELTAKVPKEYAPDGLEPGMVVRLQNGMQATVSAITEAGDVEIDANPPLAGKALTFDVELMKLVKKDQMQRALFGAGCFWGPELAFARVPGVLETAVGYAQGEVEDPTYEQVCSGKTGHVEVVQVTYDPAEVSFEQLMDVFWERHDPTQLNRQGNDVGSQYRSGVYYETEEQKAAAEASLAKQDQKLGGQIVTEVEPIKKFWPAEEYHQAYLEKGGRFGRPQSAKKRCNDEIRCYG